MATSNGNAPESPLVSIITTVLNCAPYLETCIQSVLSQSYLHVEHIFIDGGSNDGTLDVLSKYQAKYPDRIRFISEPDKGPGDAWNKGMRMAKGAILGWLGADDTLELDAVRTVVEFFMENPEAHFVFGGCNLMNERGEVIGKSPARDFNLKKAINDSCCVPCPSAFYRRDVIERVGLMDTSLPYAHDLDYWIRAGKVFQLYRIEKVLSYFRVHRGSLGGSPQIQKMYIREGFTIGRRHGGGVFSPCARRYYQLIIIEAMRPALGRFYPFINKVLRRV